MIDALIATRLPDRSFQRQALANPLARATGGLATEFMRHVGNGWVVGLSVNK